MKQLGRDHLDRTRKRLICPLFQLLERQGLRSRGKTLINGISQLEALIDRKP